jgi:hypothetical protein
MLGDPFSDDEVEEDGASYVRAPTAVDFGVRKAKAVVKTYDWYFSGVPDFSATGTIRTLFPLCHDFAQQRDWTGTLSWIPFIPNNGAGSNEIIGDPTLIIDGVKASIYAWLPKSLGGPEDVNYDMFPRQRVFFELLYVREPPHVGQDVGDQFIGTQYWRNYLYERAVTPDQAWNLFLTKDASSRGVRSLKRWSFTLDRENIVYQGKDWDNVAWDQVETGVIEGLGGNRVEGEIGGLPCVWEEQCGQKNFQMVYSSQNAEYKALWAPQQQWVVQPKSYWRDDSWIPIKCSIVPKGSSNGPPPTTAYPADYSTKGTLLLACWSDVQVGAVTPGGYSEIPQVEANFRFKFHVKQ